MKSIRLQSRIFAYRFFLIITLVALTSSAFAEIIPASKRVIWQGNVGVKNGIPDRLAICGTALSPSGGDDTNTIQNAINTCPANQTVKLNPGTFRVSATIEMKDNVTLRGSGPTQTIINTSKWRATFLFGFITDAYLTNDVNLSADGLKGATSVTLESVPAWVQTGAVVGIDQLDDSSLVCSGTANGCAQESGENYRSIMTGEDRNLGHVLKITSVSGNTVNFDLPLAYSFLKNKSAQLHQILPLNFQTTMAGVENLKVHSTAVSSTQMADLFEFSGSDNCWIKNVVVDMGTGGPMVRTFFPYRMEIRDSNFHTFPNGNAGYDSGLGYCIAIYYNATACLIENNIIYDYHAGVTIDYGGAYNVVAYNYIPGPHDANPPRQAVGLSAHGTHAYMTLFEGNDVNDKVLMDKTHGSASHSVFLRNRVTGYNGSTGGDYVAISIEGKNPYMSIVGNVLGLPGTANRYSASCPSTACSNSPVFKLGYGANIMCATTNYGGCDSVVTTIDAAHTLIHGNYAYCSSGDTGCNTQSWDAGIADHTIPVSLYLDVNQKPAFFRSLPWPPIGSDLSPMVGMLPAKYRYLHNGDEPPNGPQAVANANPKLGMPPLAVSFSSAGSSDPEGDMLTYQWNFGDGATSTAANPSHTFTTLGSYDVELTVSDGTTTSSPAKVNIFVGNKEPLALASADPTSGIAPLVVAFSSAGSSDPEGATLSYSWNFGDGSPISTTANPSHTYQAVGSYNAVLTVSDGDKTATATVLISIVNPASGLVAAYSFGEGSGTTLADLSGNNNNGAIANGTWTSGKFGGALSFNGTSTMVNVPNSASLGLTTAMTLEAWVFPTSIGGWRDLIYKANDIYFLMGSTTTNSAPAFGGTFASGNVFNTGALPLNTWSHLAATYDGSMMRLYLNGSQVATRAQTGSIMTSADPLTIGGDAVAGQYWAGKIDEIRIYNRALSAAQILTDKDAPISPTATAPSAPSNLRLQ